MKGIMVYILFLAGFFVQTLPALACEIEVKPRGEAKDVYTPDDQIIFEITVILTHRNCPEGIVNTKYKGEGLELLGATKWKEVKPGVFVQLIKAQVADSIKGEAILHAGRSCNKEGGYGSYKVLIE
jgi:hypothetical protein